MIAFSVLMSVYSGENPNWFDSALNSVLVEQSVLPNQLVVVVDGPIPKSLENVLSYYVGKFPDVVDVLRIPHNVGLGKALNEGLYKCKYELVARMDSDDICHHVRFEKQLEYYLDNPDCNVLGGYAHVIDGRNNYISKLVVPLSNGEIYKKLWGCPFVHPTVMFKKSFILDIGSYSAELKRRQDYELWFRCAHNGAKFANIGIVLLDYRVTNGVSKQSPSLAWKQAMIGYKWIRVLSLPVIAYIGVFYPLFKSVAPNFLLKILAPLFRLLDPRR